MRPSGGAFRVRLALLLVVLLSGCSNPGGDSEPGVTYGDEFTIQPRGSREVNFVMEANASVHVAFEASANVTWDVHSHPGGRVRIWQEGSGLEATIDFTAPEPDTYSVWIKSASATPVAVRYEMEGAFALEA